MGLSSKINGLYEFYFGKRPGFFSNQGVHCRKGKNPRLSGSHVLRHSTQNLPLDDWLPSSFFWGNECEQLGWKASRTGRVIFNDGIWCP